MNLSMKYKVIELDSHERMQLYSLSERQNGSENMGLIRGILSAPFYGYAGICAIAAIACPPVLVLGAASALTGAVISGDDKKK